MKQEKFCTLVIMDGLGEAPEGPGNAVKLQGTPHLDALKQSFPHTLLTAHGEEVGVIAGQMGDSEIGHLNIGSGRVIETSFLKVNNAIKKGSFFGNPALLHVMQHAKTNQSALHIMGLVSDGGVHSHTSHLRAILTMAKANGVEKVFVHVITDGRDTPTTSGKDYIAALENFMKNEEIGKIASVSGRLYAMDREENYDRTLLAYEALTQGKGAFAQSASEAVFNSYNAGVTDEYILPTVILDNGNAHTLSDKDGFIFFNFRKDRPRQIMAALSLPAFDQFERKPLKDVAFLTLTQVNKAFQNVSYAFDDDVIHQTITEVLSQQHLQTLKVAETTKYAHVTYYFNGTIETPFEGEDRVLIETIKLKNFASAPAMRAKEITDAVLKGIESEQYKLIVVNLSNCDMIGHTGDIMAVKEAVRVVDECTHQIVQKTLEYGGVAIATADHGNAEDMLLPNGEMQTAHSTNPVPFVICSNLNKNLLLREDGKLADISPTILHLLNLQKPHAMTGETLIETKQNP